MAQTYTFATKKERLAFVKENLSTEPLWALRALEVIFQRQTADEASANVTVEANSVGFSAFDAEILSSFAKQARNWDRTRFETPLSQKQMALLFKRIHKYAGQVIDSAPRTFVLVGGGP